VRRGGLPSRIMEALADVGQPLTLGQLQRYCLDDVELYKLSASMVRLCRKGLVVFQTVERNAERGRKQIKRYQIATKEK
jgi:hypothetical protein